MRRTSTQNCIQEQEKGGSVQEKCLLAPDRSSHYLSGWIGGWLYELKILLISRNENSVIVNISGTPFFTPNPNVLDE